MNSKERHFSFETNFERTSDEFRKNIIQTNNLPRSKCLQHKSKIFTTHFLTGGIERRPISC
jgi:hypothetical protein